MRIDQPLRATPVFTIPADASAPAIVLETAIQGPHVWEWEVRWRTYRKSGRVSTPSGRVDLGPHVINIGGDLQVRCSAGGRTFTLNAPIQGTNPALTDIRSFIAHQANADGFYDIVHHESRGAHFDRRRQPVVSFDGGYGLCQLTNPAPTFEEAWSWKKNIEAGLRLFAQKVRSARNYLSAKGTFTTDQLKYEAVARWNGGAYHKWIDNRWVRNPDILCDGNTGNIGWNMADPDNAGQTIDQLRRRDQATYRRGRRNTDEWGYFGVCYADRLLG